MASKKKKQSAAIVPSQNKFAESLLKIGYRFSLPKVFDDFLTISIAACTQHPLKKESHYEDEYLQTIEMYKDSELRHEFPAAFAHLVIEMENRLHSSAGNDVLGEFFEQHFAELNKGQIFTPFPICTFMASTIIRQNHDDKYEETKRVLDPTCGSGRMLLAAHAQHGKKLEYYGIDIDLRCAKMAALNLFLNGVWNSEIMCADALSPDDFRIAYRISLLPLGIFKIETKEDSRLWHMYRNTVVKKQTGQSVSEIEFKPIPLSKEKSVRATQLRIF